MKQYLNLLNKILTEGEQKTDPQGVGNIAICGHQMHFDFSDGFPLVTTKNLKGSVKAFVGELLWFLSGSTKVQDLQKYGVHIWDQWATPEICQKMGLETGDLGPIYGKQWRDFNGVDQIKNVIEMLKKNPDSRRLIVSAWNPNDVEKVFVAPCHCFFQFFHSNGKLSLHLYQRSCDVPVGIPFNIAEYSLLLMMVAQVTGLKAHKFIHTLSDAHIYFDQVSLVRTQLERDPKPLPIMRINPDVKDIFSFKPEDFILEGYEAHPFIKYPVAL